MQEIMWLWIGIGRSIYVPEFVFADEARERIGTNA